MALIQTLKDNFNDNTLSSQWTLSGSGTPANQIKELNRTLELTTTGVSGEYEYCLSTSTYDLTGSSAHCRIVNVGSQAANFDFLPLILRLDSSNEVWITVNGGNIEAYKKIATSTTLVATTAYVATTHRWGRIRESGGSVFYDTSSNGSEWTNLGSVANPFAVTALSGGAAIGQFGAASASTGIIDHFNQPPDVPGRIYARQGFQ